MKLFLSISVLILLISQNLSGQVMTENSFVEVLSSKLSKSSQKIAIRDNQPVIPAQAALTIANRNFERNRKVNDLPGTVDLNEQTTDSRNAALEKNVQESRNPKSKLVDGFLYQARIRNTSKNTIEILFWEYQFKELANPANVVTRQFLCGVNIKPDKETELRVFSPFSSGSVISVDSLDNKSGKLFEEKILINRVEYKDGKIWQRKDWSYTGMKQSIDRALETPWGTEMCRNLL